MPHHKAEREGEQGRTNNTAYYAKCRRAGRSQGSKDRWAAATQDRDDEQNESETRPLPLLRGRGARTPVLPWSDLWGCHARDSHHDLLRVPPVSPAPAGSKLTLLHIRGSKSTQWSGATSRQFDPAPASQGGGLAQSGKAGAPGVGVKGSH